MPVISGVDRPDLKYKPFVPAIVTAPEDQEDIFSQIRRRSILVHHPYESFQSVLDFIEQAAQDPNVLAIKQTLYRTSGDSQIVASLAEAAESGKQVTVVIELKARFDEAANIKWARTLQEAGVHVVYGIVGLKTHAKLALVVRKEEDGLRRYLHLGTGNYHPSTARLYTDLGYLTCDPVLTDDCAELFNWLTGVSIFPELRKIKAAPKALHEFVLEMIERETENAKAGRLATVFAKLNSLVDTETIQALYRASQAGVQIRLLVRGICCLQAQIPGVSEHIVVRSLVGRFLEHSRIFRFENGGRPVVYLASADWMPRNFFRRVETCFPIEEEDLKAQIGQMLEHYWGDNVKAREQGRELTYRRRPIDGERIDVQALFLDQIPKRKRAEIEAKPVVVKIPGKKESTEEIGHPT
jgi:polyphosphate kinase